MDVQKYINNAFFALMSGLASYGVGQLGKISDKMEAIEQTVYHLRSRIEVQQEINEKFDLGLKDHESRIRRFEHLGLRPNVKQHFGG